MSHDLDLCTHCREPRTDDGEASRFCITCDAWLHVGCLAAHAPCEPDGEGNWRHAS